MRINTQVRYLPLALVVATVLNLFNAWGSPHHLAGMSDVPGDLDTSFEGRLTGVGREPNARVDVILVLQDQRILVAGAFTRVNGEVNNAGLIRLLPTGELDRSFVAPKPVPLAGVGGAKPILCLAEQPDGRILVGGNFSSLGNAAAQGLARLLPDGSLDVSFHSPSFLQGNARIFSTLPLRDGGMFIGGEFLLRSGERVISAMAKLREDGTPDPEFQPTFDFGCGLRTFVQNPDGSLLVGGHGIGFTDLPRTPWTDLVKLRSDGQRDLTFQAPTNLVFVDSIGLDTSGRIYASGGWAALTRPMRTLSRLLADGTEDPSFQAEWFSESNWVGRILLQLDGRILVSGGFRDQGSGTRLRRFLPDGGVDPLFRQPTMAGSFAMDGTIALEPMGDGRVLIGGSFVGYNSITNGALVRAFLEPDRPPTLLVQRRLAESIVLGWSAYHEGYQLETARSFFVPEWRDYPVLPTFSFGDSGSPMTLNHQVPFSDCIGNERGCALRSGSEVTIAPGWRDQMQNWVTSRIRHAQRWIFYAGKILGQRRLGSVDRHRSAR